MGQFGFEAMELNCDTDMEEGQFKRIIWLCTLQRIPKVVVSFIQFIWMTDHTLQFVIQMSDLAGGRGPINRRIPMDDTRYSPLHSHDVPRIFTIFHYISLYFTIFHYTPMIFPWKNPMKKVPWTNPMPSQVGKIFLSPPMATSKTPSYPCSGAQQQTDATSHFQGSFGNPELWQRYAVGSNIALPWFKWPCSTLW